MVNTPYSHGAGKWPAEWARSCLWFLRLFSAIIFFGFGVHMLSLVEAGGESYQFADSYYDSIWFIMPVG